MAVILSVFAVVYTVAFFWRVCVHPDGNPLLGAFITMAWMIFGILIIGAAMGGSSGSGVQHTGRGINGAGAEDALRNRRGL